MIALWSQKDASANYRARLSDAGQLDVGRPDLGCSGVTGAFHLVRQANRVECEPQEFRARVAVELLGCFVHREGGRSPGRRPREGSGGVRRGPGAGPRIASSPRQESERIVTETETKLKALLKGVNTRVDTPPPANDVTPSAPRGSRTPSLLVRSQTLYPVELWAPSLLLPHRYSASRHLGVYRSLTPRLVVSTRPGCTEVGGTRFELVTSTMST
jgi:hypothetical protein